MLPVLIFEKTHVPQATFIRFEFPKELKASQLHKYGDSISLDYVYILDERSRSFIHSFAYLFHVMFNQIRIYNE